MPKKPKLPSAAQVSAWLRRDALRKPKRIFPRLFGPPAPKDYEVSQPAAIDDGFFEHQLLFSAHATWSDLPLSSAVGGSWGIFVTDGEQLSLLPPGHQSLEQVLRRESRPLDQADVSRFVQCICALTLYSNHVVIPRLSALRNFSLASAPTGFLVNERRLSRAAHRFEPPTIVSAPQPSAYRSGTAAAWRIRFTSVCGWGHELQQLGVETIDVSRDFRVTHLKREILARRIFQTVPSLRG